MPLRDRAAGAVRALPTLLGAGAELAVRRVRVTLGVLVAIQSAAVAAFAVGRPARNGWVFYQGGDQIWHTTGAWLLAHFEIPYALVGYGWSMAIAPAVALLGPDFSAALPPIVIVQVGLLAPIATLLVYGIGTRIAGRVGGLWVATLWVVIPFWSITAFASTYQDRWTDQFLPQAFGLTAMSDFPSLVIVLGAAYLVLASIETSAPEPAVLAGLLTGFAAGVKPANLLFLGGALLAFVVARRPRQLVVYAIGIAPSLLVLTIWKARGLAEVPIFSLGRQQLAAGAGPLAPGGLAIDRYVDLDWGILRQNLSELREFLWCARILEWAVLAGLLALLLRPRLRPAAALLSVWLGAFVLVKGTNPVASVESGSFFRLLLPAWPACLVLLAAVPLLVPTLARRHERRLRPAPVGSIRRRWVAVTFVLTVVLPLVVVSTARTGDRDSSLEVDQILVPVSDKLPVLARRTGTTVHLTWPQVGWRSDVYYRVYRTTGTDVACTSGPTLCTLRADVAGITGDLEFYDRSAPPGARYRVGVITNWKNDAALGDVMLITPLVSVSPG